MDNILLWSGLAVSCGSLLSAAVFYFVYRLTGAKLEKSLDSEYGERNKPSGKNGRR